MRSGKLKVLEFAGRDGTGCPLWKCSCDCGSFAKIQAYRLIKKIMHHCGCDKPKVRKKHGMCLYPEYRTWAAMLSRCRNKNHKAYRHYGGRGIKVCDEWLVSFPRFISDMGRRPDGAYSLDRINNNGNYEPSNCRWATWKQQHRNRRNNRMVLFEGSRITVTEMAEISGVNATTIKGRLNRGLSLMQSIKL